MFACQWHKPTVTSLWRASVYKIWTHVFLYSFKTICRLFRGTEMRKCFWIMQMSCISASVNIFIPQDTWPQTFFAETLLVFKPSTNNCPKMEKFVWMFVHFPPPGGSSLRRLTTWTWGKGITACHTHTNLLYCSLLLGSYIRISECGT